MSLSRRLGIYVENHEVPLSVLEEVLTKYRLLSLLPHIARYLRKKNDKETRTKTLVVETPFPLQDKVLKEIRNKTNAQGEYEIIINKELLAGFRATYNNKLYDGSVKSKIDAFIKS